jgi:Ca2+-binding EF-hand superfamily protein
MGLSTSKIAQRTGFTRQQISNYRRVFDEVRSINGKKCKLTSANLHINFRLDEEIGHSLFRALDIDGDGNVQFEEFLFAIYLLGPAPLEEKIEFCFKQYDVNKTGYLSTYDYKDAIESTVLRSGKLQNGISEIINNSSSSRQNSQAGHRASIAQLPQKDIVQGFVGTAFSGTKWASDEPTLGELQEHITKTFFGTADRDGDGCVTYDEFREYARSHPEILMSLVQLNESLQFVISRTQVILQQKDEERNRQRQYVAYY